VEEEEEEEEEEVQVLFDSARATLWLISLLARNSLYWESSCLVLFFYSHFHKIDALSLDGFPFS
jgi:hypothetical protein